VEERGWRTWVLEKRRSVVRIGDLLARRSVPRALVRSIAIVA
jgi:hypothetical protein